ncbi:MAG TPA: SRPBCC family protein [Candidatus Dormibacteraeota bacterium]
MGAAISVCPAGVVNAPVDRVWAVLLDSEHYGEWADARFTRFDPPGPALPGQVMEADTRELGLTFKVRLRIETIDPARREVAFDVALPFGVKERTTITCAPIDERTTRLQFG